MVVDLRIKPEKFFMKTYEVIDYLIIGEGEATLTELLCATQRDIGKIPGRISQ